MALLPFLAGFVLLATGQEPEVSTWQDNLRLSPAVAFDPRGKELPELAVVRKWEGNLCTSFLTNPTGEAVAVGKVVLFDWQHRMGEETPIYGEGLQMLSQTGGTLGRPVDLGHYTDRDHYRLRIPEGAQAEIYSLLLCETKPAKRLLAFTSCQRFVGKFVLYPGTVQVVLDTEDLQLAPGESWKLEEFQLIEGQQRDLMLSQLARRVLIHHPARIPYSFPQPPSGWCSWYCFGPRVTAEDIRKNLNWIRRNAPELRYIQIDDGYQAAMGDWLKTGEAFGGDVRTLLKEIRQQGFEPAIWVAPFIAEAGSDLFQQHPDWFIKDEAGDPLPSNQVSFGGWRRGPWYCLDGTHPEAQNFLRELFQTMRKEWGCTYFKLDANFWGMMHGGRRHDPRASRVQAYRLGMEAILEGAGDAFVLGCNHPIWPSLGLLHGSRSSMDIRRRWKTIRRTGLENLARNWQNGLFWWNDPDCLVLTGDLPESTFQYHASLLHATGGMLLSGDDLPKLDAEKQKLLASLAQPTGYPASFRDAAFAVGEAKTENGARYYLFNHGEENTELSLELPATGELLDFWSGESLGIFVDPVHSFSLPPRSARVLEFRAGVEASDGIYCLTPELAKQAIIDESQEPYFKLLQPREIEIMTGEALPEGDLFSWREEARRRFQNAVVPFQKDEVLALKRAVTELRHKLGSELPDLLSMPWNFIKVESNHCLGMAHTRGHAIVLQEGWLRALVESERNPRQRPRILALLAHEQCHVFQRLHRSKVARFYQKHFGLQRTPARLSHPWLDLHQITNPDGVHLEWLVAEPGVEGSRQWYWPRTLLDPKGETKGRRPHFTALAVFVEAVGDEFRVMQEQDGSRPRFIPLEQCQAWQKAFPVGFTHDHPNEVLAYMIGALVEADCGGKPASTLSHTWREVISNFLGAE
ncbi:MAG: alpha-galactosidase [Planctomycetota bacterium]|nr:MAG: alpha-galactosidase [Planctomycetota bacterium]